MELNKLDTNFKDNINLNYYKDIIRKVSDYDSNLKKNVLIQAVNFSREDTVNKKGFRRSLFFSSLSSCKYIG